jgi:hypothetical protein
MEKLGDEKGNNIQDQDLRYPPYRLSCFWGGGKVPGHKWGILKWPSGAIEKMLKAAFIVTAGNFYLHSNALDKERAKYCVDVPPYITTNCAWELDENTKFPMHHNIKKLWELLNSYKKTDFPPLDNAKKELFSKVTQYAAVYRYPSFSPKYGLQVGGGIADRNDVKTMIQAADQLYSDIMFYISKVTQSGNA